MGWFRQELDAKAKKLTRDVVEAYAERAHLTFELLSLEPLLNDMEMAVSWAAGVVTMERAKLEIQAGEYANMVQQITRDFFDAYCQNYISTVAKSTLRLDIESEQIKSNVTKTLESMSPERLRNSASITSRLGSNSVHLATAIIAVLGAGLTQSQGEAAARYAHKLIEQRQSLNAFERAKCLEWVSGVTWL